jgi:hypothetical protein
VLSLAPHIWASSDSVGLFRIRENWQTGFIYSCPLDRPAKQLSF